MRNPSIHINLTQFIELMETHFEGTGIKVNWEKTSKEIFKKAKPYTLNTRSVYLDTKSKKRIEKTLADEGTNTLKFQSVYIKVRRSLKHQNVKPIKPGEKDWATLKVISNNALSFCEEFNLKQTEGFTIYLKIAFQLNPKPYLNLLVNLHDKIRQYYSAEEAIDKDPYPKLTYKAYNYYNQQIIEKVGITPDYYQDPTSYLFFMGVSSIIKAKGGTVEDYIKAQFEGLAWTGSYPEPNQLAGDKALKRYIKYCFKNQIRLKK